MTETIGSSPTGQDLVRKPVSAFLWWYLPSAIALTTTAVRMTLLETAAIWSVAFTWMGVGCFLNAIRCHRLHCYVSGPVFIIGALAAALDGTGALQLGPYALNFIIWGTIGLVLLSFAPEFVWRKYI